MPVCKVFFNPNLNFTLRREVVSKGEINKESKLFAIPSSVSGKKKKKKSTHSQYFSAHLVLTLRSKKACSKDGLERWLSMTQKSVRLMYYWTRSGLDPLYVIFMYHKQVCISYFWIPFDRHAGPAPETKCTNVCRRFKTRLLPKQEEAKCIYFSC